MQIDISGGSVHISGIYDYGDVRSISDSDKMNLISTIKFIMLKALQTNSKRHHHHTINFDNLDELKQAYKIDFYDIWDNHAYKDRSHI